MKNKIIVPIILIAVVHAFYVYYFSPGLIFHAAAAVVDVLLIAAWLIITRYLSTDEYSAVTVNISGISSESLRHAVEEGTAKNTKLRKLAKQITEAKTSSTILQIAEIVDEIIDDIQKDPKDLKLANKFLSYYLNTTIKISERYIALASQKVKSKELMLSLEKTEDILKKLLNAFSLQLTKLLEDDVMDLNSELELLDITIKAEGYDNEIN